MIEDGTTHTTTEMLVASHANIRAVTINIRVNEEPHSCEQFLKTKQVLHLTYGRQLIDAACDAEAHFRLPIRSYRVTFPLLNNQLGRFICNATEKDIGEMMATLAQRQDEACTELQEFATCRVRAMLSRNHDLADYYAQMGITTSRDVYSVVPVDLFDWPGGTEAVFDSVTRVLRSTTRQFSCCLLGRGGNIAWRELSNAAIAISKMGTDAAKFCVGYDIPPGVPFYPASYCSEIGLSLGVSGAGVLTQAIRSAQPGALESVIAKSEELLLQTGFAIGTFLSEKLGLPLLGIDPTQAPEYSATGRAENSVGAAIESISGVELGRPGTKRAFGRLIAGIRQGARSANVPLTGFGPGSFLPVAEDDRLALRVGQGTLTYATLLDLTSICAAGLDMIVLQRGTSVSAIHGILCDVAESALQKQRPLAARVILPPANAFLNETGYLILGGLLGAAPELPV